MGDWKTFGRSSVYLRDARNFQALLSRSYLRESVPFDAEYAHSAAAVPLARSVGLDHVPIREGERWGGAWESGYFRLRAAVPAAWRGRELSARLDFGGEALVYGTDGAPLCGMTNSSAFDSIYRKDEYRLGKARGGEEVVLYVEAAANGLMGIRAAPEPLSRADPGRFGSWEARAELMRLCLFDEERRALYAEFSFLLDLLVSYDELSVRPARILKALREAVAAYGDGDGRPEAARARLRPELSKRADASALSTTVVGHAHIDTAWLWPLRETRRKVARTFASQMELIDRFPLYVFGASAAQHYAWIKEEHPTLFARIKEAVAAGRWEIQGGMWVESDCNLVSGESLVRQLLKGLSFFKDEFGVDVDNCWIPDVFGYPASLPQILRKSGIPYFLTQKMSWSKFNEFPHDTFRWRGLDGSEVLTHFPPERTYNSYGRASSLRKAERLFKEKASVDSFMTLLGMGDGGGGPKEDHLESIALSADCEGVPKAAFGAARDFFRSLAPRAGELETWTGELYLEYHRGTFTTQARTKKNNLRMEEDLRATEALFSRLAPAVYPAAELDALTKTMLLLQFHDIIPGSSIRQVYEDAERMHAEAIAALERLRARAAEALLEPEPDALALFNCLSASGTALAELPDGASAGSWSDGAGRSVPVQADASGRSWALVELPSQGFTTLRRTGKAASPAASGRPADELVLENELVRYRFRPDGTIADAWDKEAGREILAAGEKGNLLSLYVDAPHDYEAWDIDFYYPEQLVETARPAGRAEAVSGPAFGELLFRLEIGSSAIRQSAVLPRGSKAVSFRTEVDWKETRRLLRVSFPLAGTAAEASCGIQFGYVKRPMAVNTEWDFAKFEFCAHGWVDASDRNYGAALLSDCKYGFSARDGVVGLSLLRAPLYPDPEADVGFHSFEYRLLPHRGDFSDAPVLAEAALLKRPPLLFAGYGAERAAPPPVRVEGEGAELTALKKAEREDCWVFRVAETRGLGARAEAIPAMPGMAVRETDLAENEDGAELRFDRPLTVDLKPFELRTFKVRPVPTPEAVPKAP